ncbi:glycosyl transferase family protein [Primorskyibacter aestuariivivens]|uniref:glycosyl transferase family protein n=1 Tax=Primorskyibacter aestuariivivens TaxID=1888912 RepID=UPI0022FFE42B|nr:glycosyl transferase family protein [Primorskyibacter aestuariivivens]MDA7430453.1 glycosyl transferase family protein [Primorskyibacter aestuariivivens]
MTLAEHVRTLGRGPGRSRSLTEIEAYDAMRLMLSGDAAPEAVGALLMLLRMKGETAGEIAGFARAAQDSAPVIEAVDLDWPSYAAGRTRGAPWFLFSAAMVAQAGHRVLLHGWNGADQKVRGGLDAAGIKTARNADEANALLVRRGIAYLPLETLHPGLFRLLQLREVLGLRSCINTVCRMLNPGRANASVQGVFHPSYRLLQADAAAQLGWQSLSVIKGGGGEFERHPSKQIEAFGLRHGQPYQATLPALVDDTRRLATTTAPVLQAAQDLRALPAFETQIILGTAALAFDTLGAVDASAQATTRQGTTAHLHPA